MWNAISLVQDLNLCCPSLVSQRPFMLKISFWQVFYTYLRICEKNFENFNIKDMWKLYYFLGVKIVYPESEKLWIGQSVYTTEVGKRCKMENWKPTEISIDCGTKWTKTIKDSKLFHKEIYRSAIRSLLYLSTKTRPDLAYAVGNVARFCFQPTMQHWKAVKHIMVT